MGCLWFCIELFKAGGNKCLKSLTVIFNDILLKDKFTEEWMSSLLVPIFRGKEDPLNPNCYRGIKLLEHAFKLYKKVLNGHLRKVVYTIIIIFFHFNFYPFRKGAH